MVKNRTNGWPAVSRIPAMSQCAVEAAGRKDLAEVWASLLLSLGGRDNLGWLLDDVLIEGN